MPEAQGQPVEIRDEHGRWYKWGAKEFWPTASPLPMVHMVFDTNEAVRFYQVLEDAARRGNVVTIRYGNREYTGVPTGSPDLWARQGTRDSEVSIF